MSDVTEENSEHQTVIGVVVVHYHLHMVLRENTSEG